MKVAVTQRSLLGPLLLFLGKADLNYFICDTSIRLFRRTNINGFDISSMVI